jgi:hypothetical protein
VKDRPCSFCQGTGYREVLGRAPVLCTWCQQPPLAPAEARLVARARQGRIERMLG